MYETVIVMLTFDVAHIHRQCRATVQCNPAQYGKIFRRVIFSDTMIIVIHHHIERPVQTVFNLPMAPDQLGGCLGIRAF